MTTKCFEPLMSSHFLQTHPLRAPQEKKKKRNTGLFASRQGFTLLVGRHIAISTQLLDARISLSICPVTQEPSLLLCMHLRVVGTVVAEMQLGRSPLLHMLMTFLLISSQQLGLGWLGLWVRRSQMRLE